MKMDLQNKIGALEQGEGEASGQNVRVGADSPAAQPAGLREARAVESTVVSGFAIFTVLLAQLPAIGEFWNGGQLRGIALGHPGVHPLLDLCDLLLGEAMHIDEIAI